jgi:hypothetical protein
MQSDVLHDEIYSTFDLMQALNLESFSTHVKQKKDVKEVRQK